MVNDLDRFLVIESVPIRQALAQIDSNHFGMIFTTTESGEVVGLATDGDVRRALLDGKTLEDPISGCANRNFTWAHPGTPRETLLKHLDSHIRFVPLLDESRRLYSLISREHLPIVEEEAIYVRARAPVRISFGGGGSDLTHYFSEERGAVINTAISVYSHATMKVRHDSKIVISSLDIGERFESDSLEEAMSKAGNFGLIQALLKVVRPNFGFELYLHSDFPMGSGLGGSAALSAAVLGCLNMFRQDRWDSHEISEIAFQAERLHLGISGGWQDQYATVFGGFNFMEFGMEQNIVHPLRMQSDVLLELEESLVLCDTGIAHHSGDIHKSQKVAMKAKDVRRQVQLNVDLSYQIRNHLLRGRLSEFGDALNEAWRLKRQFSEMITSPNIDAIYAGALDNGARGGKLLGAGGGGFFIFYVPPFRKHDLMNYLDSCGLKIRQFRFEAEGLQAWSIRETRNHTAKRDI